MLLADEQAAKGNDKFVERFIASNQANCTLLEEVKSLRNKRTMARTWDRHRHPARLLFFLFLKSHISLRIHRTWQRIKNSR